MSTTRIAKRYARPLLELASEANKLDVIKKDFENFTIVCKESKEFLLMLKSPIVSNYKKAEILEKIFKGKIDDLTLSAFKLLAKKKRESLLPEVAEEFMSLYNLEKGIQPATVITAVSLDDKLKESFEKVVKDISGKTPLLKEVTNQDIIGGYILKLEDKQIDESLSSKLSDLKLIFKKQKN